MGIASAGSYFSSFFGCCMTLASPSSWYVPSISTSSAISGGGAFSGNTQNWDTVVFDTTKRLGGGGSLMWSNAHPSRLTAPFTGVYHLFCGVVWDQTQWVDNVTNANSVNTQFARRCMLQINGGTGSPLTPFYGGQCVGSINHKVSGTGIAGYYQSVYAQKFMIAGDYLEMNLANNDGFGTSTTLIPCFTRLAAAGTNMGLTTYLGMALSATTLNGTNTTAGPSAGFGRGNLTQTNGLAPIFGCRAHVGTTATAIPNATLTAQGFDATDFSSPGNLHSTTTNNSRISIPYNGYYLVLGNARWPNRGSWIYCSLLRKNGTTYYMGNSNIQRSTVTVNDLPIYSFGGIMFLSGGDYIEHICYQDSGSSQTPQANTYNCLSAILLGMDGT